MTTTVTAKIQLRKGTAAAWTSANPTLASGEIGYETDTDKLKIGDGATAWTSLAYYYDPATGGGVTDHGALTGLSDDDHSQYHNDTRGDLRYAPLAKGVTNGDSHNHNGGDGAQIAYSSLSGLPTLGTAAATAATDYATAAHNHSGTYEPADATILKQADVDDTPVNGVTTAPVSSNWAYDHAALATAHGISSFGATLVDDADASTARTTLGLGTAATTASTDYATTAHNHTGTYVAVGADAADLGSGAATDNYVLTADGAGGAAWEAAAGGDLVDDTSPQLGGNLDLNGKLITGSGGTVTTSQPIIDVSQTWNAGAVTFTGIKANITSTASAAGSLLLDLQAGGASKLRVGKDGAINGPYAYGPLIQSADNTWQVCNTGAAFPAIQFHSGYGVYLSNSLSFGWVSGTYINTGTLDLALYRDAADTLAQRRSTSAQTYRLYNTYTDASNYERLALKWGSNVCTITTEALGTGTLRGLKIGEAVTSLVGFYGVTPVVQQASADQGIVTLGNTDNEIGALTFSASPTQAECQALRDKCEELADDVRALSTLVHSLRTALLNVGLIKGAA